VIGANIPQTISSRWQAHQPLEGDRVGYEVDRELITSWQSALQALLQDADGELPNA
jgi:hypothetical protein